MVNGKKFILGVLFVALAGNSLSQHPNSYTAPEGIGVKSQLVGAPSIHREEEWKEDGNRIQILPDTERTLSSEEEEIRPSLDLRRVPSSRGFGEQLSYPGGSRLMIDKDWEIIWKERSQDEATIRPQHWKYQ